MKNLILKNEKFKIIKFLKENSKTMIAITITTLIVGSVTTYASYNYFAKDIEYIKKDGTKISINDALDYLYENNVEEIGMCYSGRAQATCAIYNIKLNLYKHEDNIDGKYIKTIYNNATDTFSFISLSDGKYKIIDKDNNIKVKNFKKDDTIIETIKHTNNAYIYFVMYIGK